MMCKMTYEAYLCVGVLIVAVYFWAIFYGAFDIMYWIIYTNRQDGNKISLYVEFMSMSETYVCIGIILLQLGQ